MYPFPLLPHLLLPFLTCFPPCSAIPPPPLESDSVLADHVGMHVQPGLDLVFASREPTTVVQQDSRPMQLCVQGHSLLCGIPHVVDIRLRETLQSNYLRAQLRCSIQNSLSLGVLAVAGASSELDDTETSQGEHVLVGEEVDEIQERRLGRGSIFRRECFPEQLAAQLPLGPPARHRGGILAKFQQQLEGVWRRRSHGDW